MVEMTLTIALLYRKFRFDVAPGYVPEPRRTGELPHLLCVGHGGVRSYLSLFLHTFKKLALHLTFQAPCKSHMAACLSFRKNEYLSKLPTRPFVPLHH